MAAVQTNPLGDFPEMKTYKVSAKQMLQPWRLSRDNTKPHGYICHYLSEGACAERLDATTCAQHIIEGVLERQTPEELQTLDWEIANLILNEKFAANENPRDFVISMMKYHWQTLGLEGNPTCTSLILGDGVAPHDAPMATKWHFDDPTFYMARMAKINARR